MVQVDPFMDSNPVRSDLGLRAVRARLDSGTRGVLPVCPISESSVYGSIA